MAAKPFRSDRGNRHAYGDQPFREADRSIKEACDLMGIAADFERKLPELETYLEGLVADGETDEDRLTVSGLCFLKGNFGPASSKDTAPAAD